MHHRKVHLNETPGFASLLEHNRTQSLHLASFSSLAHRCGHCFTGALCRQDRCCSVHRLHRLSAAVSTQKRATGELPSRKLKGSKVFFHFCASDPSQLSGSSPRVTADKGSELWRWCLLCQVACVSFVLLFCASDARGVGSNVEPFLR